MGYNIGKISVNSWNTDGSTVYDRYIYCDNFKEVLEALKWENADYMYGKGSNILDKDDEIIFHTDNYSNVAARNSRYERKPRITLKELKANYKETEALNY